jgi:Concanavalin A-like lectin/glucanases superfamily
MMVMKTVNSKMLFAAVIALAFLGTESCKKSSSGPSGPTSIGGFVSSDSVEPQALIAYFPFDGDGNDHKGGATGDTHGVTYTTGVRGQAYQGAVGAYDTIPASTALKSIGSFSLSVWYWQAAQPVSSPNTPQGMVFMSDKNADPDIILENESYAPVSGDSLEIHNGFYTPAAKNYNYWVLSTFDTMAIGKWEHFVMTYNGGTSTYICYQNGQPMLTSSAYGVNASTMLLDGPAGATPASSPLGDINYSSNPPVGFYIGTWAPGTFGVSPTLGANGSWLGKLDELRVFNIALTAKDVAGLYLNGLAGR